MIEPPETSVPGQTEPEFRESPAGPRLELVRKLSVVLMVAGGVSLVAIFALFLLVMLRKIPDFPYHYLGIGAFVLYAAGRVMGFIRRSMLRTRDD